jgi:GTPase SAR1 family protein
MGNICVIGPRRSGKTTYLAALAHSYTLNPNKNKLTIKPLNEESRNLQDKAEDIICQGFSFEPTVIGNMIKTVDDLPYFSFRIDLNQGLWRKKEPIQLNIRDYPGEVFEKIAQPNLSDTIHQEFIEECLMNEISGCMILLTAWEQGADSFYRRVMSRFLELMEIRDRLSNLRLAITMSKSERGEIWPGRLDPETDLFNLHLPTTTTLLRDSIPKKNLRFYAISTFGVLDEQIDPRPNRIDALGKEGQESYLRDTSVWKPYNILKPLYWLSTGNIL